MKSLPITLVAAALLASPLAQAKTVEAVASFSILGDIVKQVGGEHVKVSTLVGPDGDPHSFEPSPQDSKQLAQADVVFVSGLGLEGWIESVGEGFWLSGAGDHRIQRDRVAQHGRRGQTGHQSTRLE